MKNKILSIISLALIICSLKSNSQTIVIKNDSIPLGQDSVILFTLPEVRGNIQWQKSLDSENWIDIKDETKDTLVVKSDIEAMYRAVVSDGICLPVASDSAGIITTDTINQNFVDPVSIGLNLISDSTNIANGEYIYIGTDNTDEFEIGKVIVDEQSGGTIRLISEVSQRGDTITTQTEQGTMEDVFLDDDFNLSTEIIYPEGNLKSASMEELSKMLTDEEGFIHPVAVFDITPDGRMLKSASIYSRETEVQGGSLNLRLDWSDLSLFKGSFEMKDSANNLGTITGNVEAKISEGYIIFDPELKFVFSYKRPSVQGWPPKIKSGKLNKFKFYTDKSRLGIKNVIVLESDLAYKYSKEIMLKENAVRKFFKFIVGVVPVWIEVNIDVKSELSFGIDGKSIISQGFENNNYITLGAQYDNSGWSILKDFEYDCKGISTNSGFVHSEIRFDVYPQMNIKLYSCAGPSFKIGPYLKYNVTRSFDGNWDKSTDVGVEATIGASVEIMGKELVKLNDTNWEIVNWNLWKAPGKLQLVSDDKQSVPIENDLPVKVKVTASNNTPLSDVLVHFQPTSDKDRVVNKELKTDENGVVQTNWTLSEFFGEHTLKVIILNGKDEVIETLIVRAIAEGQKLPGIETSPVTNINSTTANCGGIVTPNDSAFISRGVCWNTTGNPTIDDDRTIDGSGKGSFNSLITGLIAGQKYYVRAYASNYAGTAYGSEEVFTTFLINSSFIDSRDGKTYKTVVINGEEWMAENLAYLPAVSGPLTGSMVEPCYYVYGYNGTNVAVAKSSPNIQIYGVLYNWVAALECCPAGWHLPTDTEWTEMEDYLIENGYNFDGTTTENKIAISLACECDYWTGSEVIGTPGNFDYSEFRNKTGFSAMPGGLLNYPNEKFGEIMVKGFWWSSTEENDIYSWGRLISFDSTDVFRGGQSKEHGFSVRCVKNK